nr:hypothetical protein BaRGS_005033 [Batillaria attramentaria]
MADTECAQGHGQGQVQGDDKSDISIDQISTMTLSEFKKLINSSLSVPTPGESGVTDSSSAQDSSINNAHSNGVSEET